MSRQRSYRPRAQTYEYQEYSRKKETTRSELSLLEEENMILKEKCMKAVDLEEKVEMVLKQNQQLLSQNERMARFLHQLKSEHEILRNKCETYANQKAAVSEEMDIQMKHARREIDMLESRMAEMSSLHEAEITGIKRQFAHEMQTHKVQSSSMLEGADKEIRRLKGELDRRDKKINEQSNEIKRKEADTDYQLLLRKEENDRLDADNETLRREVRQTTDDIDKLRKAHLEELRGQKSELSAHYLGELETVKRNQLMQLKELEREKLKVDDMVEERERQIQELAGKLERQKRSNEETTAYYRNEMEVCRGQIHEREHQHQAQEATLKQNLGLLHEAEIEEIIGSHKLQLRAMEEEMASLESIIHSKGAQLEQQVKDKVNAKAAFDSEMARLQDDYTVLNQKYKDTENKTAEVSAQAASRLADREKHIEYLESVLRSQKEASENEISGLQRIIDNLKQELASEKMMNRESEQALKEEISQLKNELNRERAEAEQKIHQLHNRIADLEGELNGTSEGLNGKIESLTYRLKMIQKENEGLKNSLTQKEKEIRQLQERLKASGERETRLEQEIDDLRSKLIKKEQKSNDSINDQKNRLEASFKFAIDNLKSDHEAAMRVEANKYRDLLEKYQSKEAQLEELLRRYKKMTEEIDVLTEQEANRKQMTIKYPGATAELIATKNLFDVYLKTKVIDVCGDALKENYDKAYQ